MDRIVSLVNEARREYAQEGIHSVFAKSADAIRRWIKAPLVYTGTELTWKLSVDDIVSREHLKTYAQSEGQVYTYGERERFTTSLGQNRDLPKELNSYLGTYSLQKPFLVELNYAKLLWNGGPVVTTDGKIILESVENERSLLRYEIKKAVQRFGLKRVLTNLNRLSFSDQIESSEPKPAFLLSGRGTNYYHWILEYLPKLEALEHYATENGTRPTILLEPDPPNWVLESLKLVGYSPDDWQTWTNNSRYFDCLLIPLHRSRTPGVPSGPSPRECQFIRERTSKPHQMSADSFSKIFVSRQKADSRRIRNYEEISDVLSNIGFKTVFLEDLSVRRQARIFSQADIIVAPHGAGLTNLIFAEDPIVVELLPRENIRHHYFYLANILGYEYHYLIGEQAGNDLTIDTTTVRDLVTSLDFE